MAKTLSLEHRRNIGLGQRGKVLSKESIRKRQETRRKRALERGFWFSEDTRRNMSESRRRPEQRKMRSEISKRNWSNKDYVKRCLVGKQFPNANELKLQSLLTELFGSDYKFTGNGDIIIGGFVPDFVNVNGQKKVIELFGRYWHKLDEVRNRDRRRKSCYKKYGYKTLVVWENELKDVKSLKKKLIEFHETEEV